MNKPRGLGRGLDVLLPTAKPPPAASTAPLTGQATSYPDAFMCALERLVPNRGQPRKDFNEQALEELAASIRLNGLIEPIVVRRIGSQDKFEIVAGERRWRACQRAGLREALVVVKQLDDKKAYEIALIENVQREDLNPIEFAAALRKLIDDYGHSQESLADAVGKDRTTITNALRLLKLPARVLELITQGGLTEGHGRALLGAHDEKAMVHLAELAVRKKMSVRQVEAEVRNLKSDAPKSKQKTPSIRDLEARLARKLGSRCEVRDKDGKGQLRIHYTNLDELDRILDVLL
jgi:ParB family transcriptional regulator, chromosome partitioning protein